MNKLIALCAIVASLLVFSQGISSAAGWETRLERMEQRLETQIERIKHALEKADTSVGLARIRIADQLRRSAEDLALQQEILDRLRDQLREDLARTKDATARAATDSLPSMGPILSQVESKMRGTDTLINQMEKISGDIDEQPQESCLPTDTSAAVASSPSLAANSSVEQPEPESSPKTASWAAPQAPFPMPAPHG